MYDLIGQMPPSVWADIALDDLPIRWNEHGWGSVNPTALLPFREDAQRLLSGVGVVGTLTLIAIKPAGLIRPHEDGLTRGWTRFHFVLTTNAWCWSFHDAMWQQLQQGGIYRMDANKIHASVNLGDTTRWHLIADTRDGQTSDAE